MECPKCQQENPADSKFCLKCGGKVERVCPSCAKPLPAEAVFCNACGQDLSKPATPSDTLIKPAEPSAPSGERRQATIVFSDLSGYTAMNEKLDPEEVEGIMSRIKAEAVRIVERQGGIVNQFVGDEVLALFGIPTAHEDDPRRAVTASLELHELARNLGAEVEPRIGAPLRMHTGINTGLVVTHLRDDREGRYGITGDAVNTAARLVSRADPDEILLSPDTRRLVAPFFDLEELAPVAVKGKARPMVPYLVVGASGIATRFEAAEERGFTPHTGREAELATLHGALERASSGHGQFVTVSGEAGLGKSRLLHEFRRNLDREAYTILQGRCQSFGGATPYLPFTDALGRGLGLRDDMTPTELAGKAGANLLAIDAALEAHLPVLLHLLSITSGDHPLPDTLQGEALRRAGQEALAAVILAQATRQPVVLVLEDWHWVDEASDSALRFLLGLTGTHRLLVVVNYRPEYDSGWGRLEHHAHLTIGPLGANHSEIVAKAVLEAERLPEGLGELIHERTGGNPFFIEEMCHDLLESGTVLVKDGQGALTRPAEKLDLPANVQAVIRSRLDRLDEANQEVIRLASVIGREFDLRLLAQAQGGGHDAGPLLENMRALGLIQQVRIPPEATYQFKHVLTQVVVYETLLLERRKALHGLVGRAMEELYADRLEERVEQLAHHFRLSGDTTRAVTYLEQAGRKATQMSMYQEAYGQFAAAVELLKLGKQAPETKTHIIGIILRWANAGRGLNNDDLYEALSDAITVADGLGDDTVSLRLNYQAGFFGITTGYRKEGRGFLQQARELAENVGDREERIVAYSVIGQGYWQDARLSEASMFLDKAIHLAETAEKPFSSRAPPIYVSMARSYCANLHSVAGEFEKARDQIQKAIQAAASVADRDCELYAKTELGQLEVTRGDFGKGKELLRDVLETSHDISHRGLNPVLYLQLGRAIFHSEDQEQGIELIEKAIEAASFPGLRNRFIFPYAINGMEYLAYLHARLGRKELAWRQLDEAAKTHFEGNHEKIFAFLAKAFLASQESPPDWRAVERHLADGKKFAKDSGFRPGLAETHFHHAEILHKKGDLDRAREQLGGAEALFADLGMMWWPDRAEGLRGRIERGEPFLGFTPYGDKPVS